MKASRRSFMVGATALAVAARTSAKRIDEPVIYTDGVRDSTAGLHAALSGRPFRFDGEYPQRVKPGEKFILRAGIYKVKAPLTLA